MAHRYYRLPSLTSLTAFEAAARHRSLKHAAEELNVTPGAISRQIKSLEDELGVPLFIRAPTGLVLTAQAQELYAVLSHVFSRAAETVATIRSGNRVQRVTLACTNAFATCWLMPRMGDFWRRYPEITVDHLITDDVRDFRRTEVDLRVRYGLGAWRDETSMPLLDEAIYPISGPGYAREHADATAADIPELSLLHVDWVDAEWTGWDELLRRAAIPHGPLARAALLVLQHHPPGLHRGAGPRHRLAAPDQRPRRRRQDRALHRPEDPGSGIVLPHVEHEPHAVEACVHLQDLAPRYGGGRHRLIFSRPRSDFFSDHGSPPQVVRTSRAATAARSS